MKISMISLTVLFEFSASHRLYKPDLSDEENFRLFGKCSNPNGHGHNYTLEVTADGTPRADTGMLIDAGLLKEVVDRLVITQIDHKDLNRDVPWLEGTLPTTESVARAIFERLAPEIPLVEPGAQLHSVRLQETRRIWVTVTRTNI